MGCGRGHSESLLVGEDTEHEMMTATAEMAAAFLKAQQAFRPAVKDSENPHFKSKFVSLQGALDATLAALHENGFSVLQPTDVDDHGRTIVVTTLLHTSGQYLAGRYPVTASQAGPQGEGSGLTYARRYALMALLGIAPEDDDGNAAQASTAPATSKRQEGGTPPKPTASELRGRIATVAQQKGLTLDEVADDFASWSMGTAIKDATAAQLGGYLASMEPAT